jgi:hypothetical protein
MTSAGFCGLRGRPGPLQVLNVEARRMASSSEAVVRRTHQLIGIHRWSTKTVATAGRRHDGTANTWHRARRFLAQLVNGRPEGVLASAGPQMRS